MGSWSRENVTQAAREALGIAVVVALAALVLHVLRVGCPIKFLTGVSCPGCGMTRAWLCALCLDFPSAVAYHPLFWLVPVAVVLAVLQTHVGGRALTAAVLVCVALFVALWVVRLLCPSDATLLVSPQAIPLSDVVNVSAPGQFAWLSFR